MTTENLAAVYRRYLQCLNERRWNDLHEFVREDLTYNAQPMTLVDYRAARQAETQAIPDLRFTADLVVTNADTVAARPVLPLHSTAALPRLRAHGHADLVRRTRLLRVSRREDRAGMVTDRHFGNRRADRGPTSSSEPLRPLHFNAFIWPNGLPTSRHRRVAAMDDVRVNVLGLSPTTPTSRGSPNAD